MKQATEKRAFRIWVVAAASLIIVALAVYVYLALQKWEKLSGFGALGDAIGPFAGLATALALGAAIYATILQREELRLQRREMRAHRREVRAQREATVKAAAAQERLAKAQEDLARAQQAANDLTTDLIAEQHESNRLAWFHELAQRRANVATLWAQVASANIAAASVAEQARASHLMESFLGKLKPTLDDTNARIAEEEARVRLLEEKLGVNKDARRRDV